MLGPDDFERTLDKKAALVEELNCLDDGFQQIYEQVRPEIESEYGQVCGADPADAGTDPRDMVAKTNVCTGGRSTKQAVDREKICIC